MVKIPFLCCYFSMFILKAWRQVDLSSSRSDFPLSEHQSHVIVKKAFSNPIYFDNVPMTLLCAREERCVTWSIKGSFDAVWFIYDMNPYRECSMQCAEESDFFLFKHLREIIRQCVTLNSNWKLPKALCFIEPLLLCFFSHPSFVRQVIHSKERTQNVNLPSFRSLSFSKAFVSCWLHWHILLVKAFLFWMSQSRNKKKSPASVDCLSL
jgi:hypothetical protein